MAVIDPLKIHLTNILNVSEFVAPNCQNFTAEELNIGVAHKMMHNLEQKKVKLNMMIEILCNKMPEDKMAVFCYDFFYTIDDLESHFQMVNDKPLFDGVFVSTLISIAYSTTRGMLFNQFTEAPLKNIILPVINVPDLLKNKY
jgi:hypothetical protein